MRLRHCKNTHISKLKLQVNRAGGDKVTYLVIDMEEVVISSVNFVAGGEKAADDKDVSDLPTEEIKFNFARIKTTYTQQQRTNGQGGSTSSVVGTAPVGYIIGLPLYQQKTG